MTDIQWNLFTDLGWGIEQGIFHSVPTFGGTFLFSEVG
jgi:hypothetical protein